jgi:sugar/nucleoside kinase (ribokinase family)
MSKIRIATIGYLISDWLMSMEESSHSIGRHPELSELKIEPGGICNFLIAGQRLGGEMHALDAIGADEYGLSMLRILENEGVDISQVIQVAGSRSRSVVVISKSATDHEYYPFAGDLMPKLEFSQNWRKYLNKMDVLYIDGFALRQEYIHSAVIDTARWMAEAGKKVFFDPGPGVDEPSNEVLPWVYGLLLTEEELLRWGKGSADELFLASETIQMVVTKQGQEGCTIFPRDNSPVKCPGFSVEVHDTMGAGDVFNAAFILSTLEGKSPFESGRFANAAGAAKVKKFGAGKNVPTLDEVEKLVGKVNRE